MTPVRQAIVFFTVGAVVTVGCIAYSVTRGQWIWVALLAVALLLAIKLVWRGVCMDRASRKL
jgi:hypothetical protein